MNEVTPPEGPDNEYIKRVLARFETRHSSFIKQSTIFFIFVFSFLVFVLIPIMSLKVEADRIVLEIEQKPREVAAMLAQDDALRTEEAKLAEERNSVNGELTSLNSIKEEKEKALETAESKLVGLKEKLKGILGDEPEKQKRLKLLASVERGMNQALGIFDAHKRVSELRGWFRQKAANCSQVQECQNDWHEYYAHEVRRKLQSDWDNDFDFVNQEIVQPLKTVEPEIAETIKGRLTEARNVFETNLDQDPEFWQTIDEKAAFMDKLAVEWDRAFAGIQSIVHERLSKVQNEIAELKSTLLKIREEGRLIGESRNSIKKEQSEILKDIEDASTRARELRNRNDLIEAKAKEVKAKLGEIQTDLKSLQDRQREIQVKQTEIAKRLNSFQSPFGTLPLGFEEAALVFPFILAVGFLVCSLLLASLMRLRREYHQLVASNNSLDTETVTNRVLLIAPLWLDPAVRSWRNTTVVLLMMLPIPIFFLTASLISSDWLLHLTAVHSGRYLMLFYDTLYLIGILLLTVGIWQVRREWNLYRAIEY